MQGKDYYQIVDPETDERYCETEDIKDALRWALQEIRNCSRSFRENHLNLIGALETYIECLEDEQKELAQEIKAQLDSVDSRYCD